MSPRTTLLASLLAAAAACRAPAPASAPAAAAAEPTPETITLVVVDDRPLTLRDALDTFLSSHAGHGVLVRGEPAVRELAGRLVERALFLAEARSLGIPEDPRLLEVVEAYRLKTAEIEYWEREVDRKVEVPEEEVEAFWAKTDVALSLSILETKSRQESEALREEVLAGADFGELASARSTHASRNFGGQAPYVRRGELDPALEAAAFALEEPGALTPVVRTQDGFAFARLDERTVNEDRPPREVMLPRIRNILHDRREDELRAVAEARVRELGAVRIDETRLTRAALLAGEEGEAVVAESAGERLTLGEMRELLDLDAVRAADEEPVADAARGIAEEWAQERAVALAIERDGLLADPQVVEKTEAFRRDAILGMLYREWVYADIAIEEADVRAYWEEHKDTDFTRPAEVRLAYVLLATPEEAQRARERLAEGEDFEELAREVSIDPTSAAHGGRIGWVRPGQILPAVEEAAFALAPGTLSEPIETEQGVFLLEVLESKPAVVIPYERCAGPARRRLERELQQKAYAAWALRLRERAEVELDDEGIRQAVAWLDREAEREAAEKGDAPVGPMPAMPGAPHGGGPPPAASAPHGAPEGAP